VIEDVLGKKANMEFMDMQPGDVIATYADVDDLMEDVGFKPETPVEIGIKRFVQWFKDFYGYN
jgi:UDP-glucuronate 4-epimerase